MRIGKGFSVIIILFVVVTGLATAQSAAPEAPTAPRPRLKVAFVVSERFNIMDFAGPWEVFNVARLPIAGKERNDWPRLFEIYTVSDATAPIQTGGNQATLVPSYTFANAPKPDIIVIGAQDSNTPELFEWLRTQNASGTTLMSVCIGASKLARAGLLDGKSATTHHGFIADFQGEFTKTKWLKDLRYVRVTDTIYTSGGLTSGIDLALHLVAKRFGEGTATATAEWLEYQGTGWTQKE